MNTLTYLEVILLGIAILILGIQIGMIIQMKLSEIDRRKDRKFYESICGDWQNMYKVLQEEYIELHKKYYGLG